MNWSFILTIAIWANRLRFFSTRAFSQYMSFTNKISEPPLAIFSFRKKDTWHVTVPFPSPERLPKALSSLPPDQFREAGNELFGTLEDAEHVSQGLHISVRELNLMQFQACFIHRGTLADFYQP